jgi:hypothetical protein
VRVSFKDRFIEFTPCFERSSYLFYPKSRRSATPRGTLGADSSLIERASGDALRARSDGRAVTRALRT